ncbi:18462_t:CDS:1, partial [Racocetra persica]
EILLKDHGYQILLSNYKEEIKLFTFVIPFFKIIKSWKIIVDATYKTNILGYELYTIIGQYDGAGFALAYLFVEGKNKADEAHTEILALFFKALYE